MILVSIISNSFLLKRTFARLILLLFASIIAFGALVSPLSLRPTSYALTVGAVAREDIVATRSMVYQSKILTERAKQEAEKNTAPVYLDVDPTITRGQLEKLRTSFNFINNLRADNYATPEQKIQDLGAITDPAYPENLRRNIFELSDQRWEATQQETLKILEQVMRTTIREDQIGEAERTVPTLVSFSLAQDQAAIVTRLVTLFIVPNSVFSEDLTAKEKAAARDRIGAVERRYTVGEIIVRQGQIITPETYEALQQFGLINTDRSTQKLLSAAAAVLLVNSFIMLYFLRRKSRLLEDLRGLAVVIIYFLLFLIGSRFLIPNRTIIPYLYPVAAFGLTLASLYSLEIAIVFSLSLGILSVWGITTPPDLVYFYLLGSFIGIFSLGKARRLANFFWAGLATGLAGSMVILAYRLPTVSTDLIGAITLMATSILNGLASASLALLFQFLFAQILGLTTPLQLLEISRPDHPLLQFMLQNAPGSYQHSLQVSNLAEQAAERIGADGLLVRVGAIYHDVGKARNPSFFIENQVPGKLNSHDDIDPALTASTIIQHIEDGVSLAKKYHIPPQVIDFIREHHGTLITKYQYTKAVQAANNDHTKVNIELFRYSGPKPRSRETALLMLADGCEARARAELPRNDDELRQIIKKVFDFCQQEGQLDNTAFTLRDLTLARESFFSTLRNTYHPRIQYPELRIASLASETAPPKKESGQPS
ncbi:MAG: HDIG domain-containing protein [Anaerolineaceae bacterium]|nr:HDIG domain-containing protein [Anaerolineaceae bacterium]